MLNKIAKIESERKSWIWFWSRLVHQGKEPLKRFAEAKKFMGDIYADLEAYIDELTKFYRG